MGQLFEELKRRNVLRVGFAYLVVGWLVIEVIDTVAPRLGLPDWVPTFFIIFVAVGLPIALILAWAFELTPEGVKKAADITEATQGAPRGRRKLDFAIVGLLVVALGYFIWESRFQDSAEPPPAGTVAEEGQTTIAVLPFVNMSSDAEQEYFADGLTEEILNSLARLPELRVTARTSAFHFKGRNIPIPEIAKALGVAHVVEGSVRRDGDALRVTAQLVRAEDGFHLWTQTYDRSAGDVFAVQEDIAESIASALDIVLDDRARALMFAAGTRDVEAFEAYLKGRALYDSGHQLGRDEDRWRANEFLEEATRLDPEFAAAHALHHDAYAHFLMNDIPANDPALTAAEALAHIRDDFARATVGARDPRLRLSVSLAGYIFSDSWRGVADHVRELEEFMATGGTEIRGPGWIHMLLIGVGRADLSLARSRNEISYDPLHPFSWSDASGSALALGDVEAALDYARKGLKVHPDHNFLLRDMAVALILSGAVEEGATKLLAIGSSSELNGIALALLGRDEEARELVRKNEALNPREAVWVYMELGDSDEAARVTAAIDADVMGALQFLRLIYYSGGFAAFDIDAAPNFRARLGEAGADPADLKPWLPLAH